MSDARDRTRRQPCRAVPGARQLEEGSHVKIIQTLLSGAAAATLFTACMHHGVTTYASGDVVGIDSLSATRTAIVRVENNSPTEVKLYTIIPGQKTPGFVGEVQAGQTHSMLLDPMLLPDVAHTPITLEIRSKDGSATKRFESLHLEKGQTVEVVVPDDLDAAHVMIHQSAP
jgi:hypothetical protein